MRILHVTNAYPPHIGGTERYVSSLVNNQRLLGSDVYVMTSNLPNNVCSQENVIRLPVLYNFKGSWGELPICPTIFKALAKINCDIIHTHMPSAFFLESVTISKPLLKKKNPIVLTYHLHNESLTYLKSVLWDAHNRVVVPWILRNTQKIIVLTQTYRTLLNNLFQVSEEKIEVVPPGVDDKLFDPQKYKLDEIQKRFGIYKENIIVFVGRLTDMKGIDYLMKALPIVRNKLPDASLLVIGGGSLETDLKVLSRKLGLEMHVHFMGQISDENVRQLLSLANVVALPSISEGFGLVLLEAMSMKKPVVATRVGGSQEVVINGKTGFLVEKKNVERLAEALLEILCDEKLAENMGRLGRKLVQEKYCWTAVAKRVLDIYEEALTIYGN